MWPDDYVASGLMTGTVMGKARKGGRSLEATFLGAKKGRKGCLQNFLKNCVEFCCFLLVRQSFWQKFSWVPMAPKKY